MAPIKVNCDSCAKDVGAVDSSLALVMDIWWRSLLFFENRWWSEVLPSLRIEFRKPLAKTKRTQIEGVSEQGTEEIIRP